MNGINYNLQHSVEVVLVLGSLLRCSTLEENNINQSIKLCRQSFGNSISSGIQYEFETYIKKQSKVILTLILLQRRYSIPKTTT
jgi:hypothetical protein